MPNTLERISDHVRDAGSLLNRFASGLDSGAAADVRIELPRGSASPKLAVQDRTPAPAGPAGLPDKILGVPALWFLGGAAAVLVLAFMRR